MQFLLSNKAFLAFNRGEYAAMQEFALEGIKITLPDFDEDEIDTYVLTFDEICLINQYALSFLYQNELENSLKLYLKLKVSMDNSYVCVSEKIKTYIIVLYNLSKSLGLSEKYEESLEIEDEAIKLCKQYHEFYFLPQLLYNKACSLYYLGRKKEAKTYLERAYYLSFALGNDTSYEEDLAKEFGVELISPSTK
ncbi:MAG: hypothetical protein LBE35_07690 [Clostridiales bacterium]|jgi:tetratricopeptide (TPR) repeat protein|nr:hypothetical protein [Clostridiales bacterium]